MWDAGLQEFHEVEADKLGPVERARRNRAMAQYILASGCTIRQAGEIFGIHNSNVYRAIAPLLGSPYSDVREEVWPYNKAVSLERATAARKARKQGCAAQS
jgi:hypothetical protein